MSIKHSAKYSLSFPGSIGLTLRKIPEISGM